MSEIRRIRLEGQLAEPISHYVDATVARGLVYISGMLPTDVHGRVIGKGDVVRQTEQVLDNIGAVLSSVAATFDDIVRVGVFLRRMEDREAVNTVRRRYFDAARPASTLVEVSALADADALLEIEAIAVVPAETAAGSTEISA